MNNKTDNNFLFLLIVISIIIGAIVLSYFNPWYRWTKGIMRIKELQITQMEFTASSDFDVIILHVTNSGVPTVTVNVVKINGETQNKTIGYSIHGPTIEPGDSGTITAEHDWISGNKFIVDLFNSDGKYAGSYTDIA